MDYLVLLEGAAAGLAGGVLGILRQRYIYRRNEESLGDRIKQLADEAGESEVKFDKAKKQARIAKRSREKQLAEQQEAALILHGQLQDRTSDVEKELKETQTRLRAAAAEISEFRTKLERAVEDTNRRATEHAIERDEIRNAHESGMARLHDQVEALREVKQAKVVQEKTEESDYHAELYSKWCVAKGELAQSIDSTLESFLKRVRTSEHALVLAHGCKSVRFDVEIQGKRVALVPTILREEAPSA